MKAIVCNKCEIVITDEKKLQNITRLDMCTAYLGKYSEAHLCDNCKSEFHDWLKGE